MIVYHLTSSQHALSSLSLQKLKLSRFDDLNNPFELLAAELSEKEHRQAIRSWKRDFHEHLGMLCFSKDWSNPVLWSHYGDKHRGIALGIEVQGNVSEVNYVEERIPVRFNAGDPDKGLCQGFVHELLEVKYKHWEYENEVRIFS